MAKKITFYRAIFILLTVLGFSGTSAFGQCTGEVLNISAPTPSLTGTAGNWTVPAGGPFKVLITAKGAKGGNTGGLGAVMAGQFFVASGQNVQAMAGAPGSSAPNSGGSGGGASGVQVNSHLFIIAGAGGGGGYSAGGNASLGPDGMSTGEGQGGTNGNGGQAGNGGGGGGGGIYSPGGSNEFGFGGGGGSGGFNATGGIGANGGFPGGGGIGGGGGAAKFITAKFSGGGGGYSGGGGSLEQGGGGGSYNAGANQNNAVTNNGGGQVIIECLGAAVFTADVTPTQPVCANPTQGSLSIDLTDDNDGNTAGLEYAIVSGNSFAGTPAFADITADPFNITSGFGTVADLDGETYTIRVRLKYNPTLFIDHTYTLTSPTTRIWTGALSTDWHTDGNWSPTCVPTAADSVAIPDMTNDPTIITAAVAKSVTVQSGAVLTIASAGALTVDGSSQQGILNQGTVENNGAILIGQTISTGSYGILNQATFHNNTGGQINIDRSTYRGILNQSAGTFTNAATISIGAVASAGPNGIENQTTFHNNMGGQINIDRTTYSGIWNQLVGTFTNAATINIGAVASPGYYGIWNEANFNNNTGGQINIDRSIQSGIYSTGGGTFTNAATINIGAVASAGYEVIRNEASFHNNTGGQINIDRFTNSGIMNGGGTFINAATITIGAVASAGLLGIDNISTFNNSGCSALIHIVSNSIINGGSLNNSGIIIENASGTSNITDNSGIVQNLKGGTFTITNNTGTLTTLTGDIWTGCVDTDWATAGNWHDGSVPTATDDVTIPDVSNDPVISGGTAAVAKSVHVQANALLTINTTAGLTINGSKAYTTPESFTAGLNNEGAVENSGGLVLGSVSSVGRYGIFNQATFHNKPGGDIRIDRSMTYGLGNSGTLATFTNEAGLIIGANAGVGDIGIYNQATFHNKPGGDIQIDRSTLTGLRNNSGAFTNEAGLIIGANTEVGRYGIYNQATFRNKPGGNIQIDRSNNGLANTAGAFTNEASLIIGANAAMGTYGIQNIATFTNSPCSALIDIRSNSIIDNTGSFTNAGAIIENASGTSSITNNSGIVQNLNGGTFTITNNTGLLTTFEGVLSACCPPSDILYVDYNAVGANNGTSWTDAYTDLQSALNSPCSNITQIWVAAGTYKPTAGNDRNISFSMKSGVAIYGGFNGTETQLSERNWSTNVTILSGDLNGDDGNNFINYNDNSYHVVSGLANGIYTLDGFIIERGNSNGVSFDGGAGLLFLGNNQSVTLSNCIIRNNLSNYRGAGVDISPMNFGTTLELNVYNSFFLNNSAPRWSALFSSAMGEVVNTVFAGNQASIISIIGAGQSTVPFSFVNCTFHNNPAPSVFHFSGTRFIKNCIVTGSLFDDGNATISNSIVSAIPYGSIDGGGNIFAATATDYFSNPSNLAGTDNKFGTIDDGLTLVACSPAIDAGFDADNPTTLDLTVNTRKFEAIPGGQMIDMGAYEYQGTAVSGPVVYVNDDASGNNDGTSWDDAFNDLQDALALANTCSNVTEIWVASGTYYPTTGADRTISFVMKNDLAIYGGFAGTETSLTERDWTANVTTLSGDISTTGDNSDNSYHVIFNNNNGLNSSAILDGFTISGGNADGTSPNNSGSGMLNIFASPLITNCTFSGNSAFTDGGGINNSNNSSPIITNCTFKGNSSGRRGGGIYNSPYSVATFINCVITGNSSTMGGGIFNNSTSPYLTNCSFSGNTATTGGGMQNNDEGVTGPANPVMTNCIFWGNSSEIFNKVAADPVVTYSIVQGGYTGTGNLDVDPLFVSTSDLRLQPCSPAINTGSNASVPSGITTDLDRNPRFYNSGTVDMGAYEYQGNAVSGPAVYVNDDASGNNDGTSWTDAFNDLQDALALANTCSNVTEIWVASGTYKPTTGADRTISFVMKNDLAIYGGFAGTETSLTERDWTANVTTLSGDISTTGDNSYHVISNPPHLSSSAILDGFTITGGNANGDGDHASGGGIFNGDYASPTISNCRISGNFASNGGGWFSISSYALLTNVTFSGNNGGSSGGGMFNAGSLLPSLVNVEFSGNNAGNWGGGIFNQSGSFQSLTNVTFAGNKASEGGGIYYNFVRTPQSLKNCIFWGNSSGIYYTGSNMTITNSILQESCPDGATCTGVLNADPLFVSQPDFNAAPTVTGDLRLQPCSPAINAGDNALVPSGITTDLDGNPRFYNSGTVDMGAYEYQGNAVSGPVVFVNDDASGNNDGTSWTDAFNDLQDALALANTCSNVTEIWVASGTYYPTTGTDRTISFVMKNGLAIYGGFAGTETSLSERDWMANVTTLSGDISTTGDNSDNSYHVIFNNNNGLTSSAILDGFTISGGNANEGVFNLYGGGILNYNSSPTIQNCVFRGNTATYGGGMGSWMSTSTITNCTFLNNSATNGGGLYSRSSIPSTPSATLTNCAFSGNSAQHGGGMFSMESTASLINCTFAANIASISGSGVYSNDGIPTSSIAPVLTNCILWNSENEVGNSDCQTIITNSIIKGGYTGTGNLNVDPLFVDAANPAGPDGYFGTADDGISIQSSSPAINAGNAAVTTPTTDITGFTRTGVFDMGAYENQSPCANPVSGGTVSSDQNGCSPFDPDEITGTTPTGQIGIIEYKWQSSTTGNLTGFADIDGATAANYNPGTLTDTTWYRRLARVSCITDWIGAAESNVIEISVGDVTDPDPDNATLADVTAEVEVTSLTAPTAYDNCAGTITATPDVTLPITAQGTTVVTWTYDDGNGNSITQTQNVVIKDVTKPSVTAFTIPASSASLVVPVTSFTATDYKAVTGFKLTETPAAPVAGDAGWTTVAPTSYTFATEGTKTLYAWAKDEAGNVSTSLSDQVVITLPDVTNSEVTAFTIPESSASLAVEITSFTATDNKAVTGFKLTETSAAPLAGDADWTTVAPTSYTFATEGTKTLYAWAKDAAGNVSTSLSDQVVITLPDVTSPEVTAFTIPESSASLEVAITSFTATDNKAVTGFMLTESATSPLTGDAGWTTVAPTSYTFATEGTKTLYAWAKDAAGNVSTSLSAPVVITLSSATTTLGSTEVFGLASSSTVRRAIPVTFDEAGQIQSISVYHNAGSGNVILGVYSDVAGFPSVQLGVTPSTAVNATAGWQTVTLTTPVNVTSGQKVWLAWVFQNVSNIRYERTTVSASVSSGSTWSSGMPSAFGKSYNGNFKFSVYCTYTTGNVTDVTKPIVTAFTIPTTSASLVVPVSSFTATDNKAVTGFKLTETSAAPLAGDAGWTTVAPTSYTFITEGTKILYAWAKDEAGNVSSAKVSAQVTISLSSTAATLGYTDAFSLSSSSTVRRAIPVTFNVAGQIQSISVHHNARSGNVILGVYSDVSGFPSELLSVTPSTAVRTTEGWQTVTLTTPVTVASGQKVWLAWVFQNVPYIRYERTTAPASVTTGSTWSSGMPSPFGTSYNANFKFSVYCSYTTNFVSDVTKPIVTAFTIPATSASLIVPVSSFTATDNKTVTGFKLTETSAAPLAGDEGWTTVAPTSYTFATEGTKTLYAWAKDEAGNVSESLSAQVVIPTVIGYEEVFGLASLSTNRRAIPVTFNEAGKIQSISVYHNAGSGNVLLGVYSDEAGRPSALLGVTPSTAVRTTAGWQTISLTTPVNVTSGQKVWLAWVFENVSNIRFERTSTPASVVGGIWSSGMQSTFGTSYNANFKFSVYCTYIADNTKSAVIAGEIEPVFEKADLKVYPNPFSERLRFEFVSPESVNARIDLFDMTGRLVKTIFEQPIEGGVNYEAEFRPETIISGMYIYRMTMGENVYNGKVVFKKE